MTANAVDHLFTQVVVSTCGLVRTPLLEPIVATLNLRQKIEMLKSITKSIKKSQDWRKGFVSFCNTAEAVRKQRKIACYTPAKIIDGKWVLSPASAAELFGNIDFANKEFKDLLLQISRPPTLLERPPLPQAFAVLRI